MKNKRPVFGLALVVVALFITFGDHCGVVGKYLLAASVYLVGGLGTVLVVVVLLLSAYFNLVPPGKTTVFVRRVSKRLVDGAGARSVDAYESKLADVEAAMKNLGFAKREYERLVQADDLHMPVEEIVRKLVLNMHRWKEVS